MKPGFQIKAGTQDVTAKIADRLLSLSIHDEDGIKADRMMMRLDNRDGAIEIPPMEDLLSVWLGYQGAPLTFMGVYAIDAIEGEGPALEMSIKAKAADFKGGLKAPKTRAWQASTLKDIVAKIAAEAGLDAVVGDSVAGVAWDYLAQTAESDLNFLTRIAATLDATAKPAGGTLLVQKRGEGKNAAGQTIAPIEMSGGRLSSWSWAIDTRESYGAVEAEWGAVDAAQVNKVKRGSAKPVKKLRHLYPTEAEAIRAADAELALSGRSVMTMSATVAGFEGGLFAGGSVRIGAPLNAELQGTWHVSSVTHDFKSGLVTSFQARKATEE